MDTRSGWDSDSDKHGAGPRGSGRKVRHLASRLGNGAYASLAGLGAPVFQATAIPGSVGEPLILLPSSADIGYLRPFRTRDFIHECTMKEKVTRNGIMWALGY